MRNVQDTNQQPDDDSTTDRYAGCTLGGDVVIFDRENPDAWIRVPADRTMALR